MEEGNEKHETKTLTSIITEESYNQKRVKREFDFTHNCKLIKLCNSEND